VVGAEVSVLVIGDDEDCFVETVLKAEGWEVTTADAGDAVARVEAQRPDLVVLYSGRFGLGLEVCSALRSRSRVPVIVLSRSSSEDDVVAGLRGGADAMVVEGIGAREFVARARALLRRVPPPRRREPNDAITVGPVVLNRATRQVMVDGKLVAMPRREFDILEVLMRDVDRTVTRETLRRQLWGISRDSQTLDVQVRRLRARLAAVEGCRRIITVRSVGYRFSSLAAPPVEVEIDFTKAAAAGEETAPLTAVEADPSRSVP
jgi:two-component system response regulator RegX3